MFERDEVLTIITIGRQFWQHPKKLGIWAAELLWVDDDGQPVFDQLKGQAFGSNHVALEVQAALEGLKRAAEIQATIEVRSVNESVVKTIPEYAPKWKAKGWKKSGGPIASLDEWKEIDAICETLQVDWRKRPKEEIDHIDDFERLWKALEERENDYAMKRALARDPYR